MDLVLQLKVVWLALAMYTFWSQWILSCQVTVQNKMPPLSQVVNRKEEWTYKALAVCQGKQGPPAGRSHVMWGSRLEMLKQPLTWPTVFISYCFIIGSGERVWIYFIIKVLVRSGIQGTYLNTIKAIYSKPIANIKLNGEKLKAIPLKSGTRQGCPLSPYLFKIILEVLARAIRYQRKSRKHKFERKKSMCHCSWMMIVYISNPNLLPENCYTR